MHQAGLSEHGTADAGVRVLQGEGSQAIVRGHVLVAGSPLPMGYVRMLDPGGDFVAEVPLGADGSFTFYPVTGDWTLRLLGPGGLQADRTVTAENGMITELDLTI